MGIRYDIPMLGCALAGLWKEFAGVSEDAKSFCKQILQVHAETSNVFCFSLRVDRRVVLS